LMDEYREDIQQLEKLIDKDLSVWMRAGNASRNQLSTAGHG
jgi:hypothetical protein